MPDSTSALTCSKVRRNGLLWPGASGETLSPPRPDTDRWFAARARERLRSVRPAPGILKSHVDRGMGYRLAAGIGDGSVKIGHGRAHKILRRAHLQIGEFETGGVGRRRGRRLWLAAREPGDEPHREHYKRNAQTDRNPIGFALRLRQRRWFDQPAHGRIVLLRCIHHFGTATEKNRFKPKRAEIRGREIWHFCDSVPLW